MKKILYLGALALSAMAIPEAGAQTGNTTNGTGSGAAITTGDFNTFVGYASGYRTTAGSNNLFLGVSAGRKNTTGNHNVFVGRNTGYNNLTGASNLFLGQSAGYSNTSGNGNVFIGVDAGFYEMGSKRLYIASGRSNPLVYGEFDNKLLKVNGTLAIVTDQYNGTGYKLYVADGIRTEAVQIDAEANWPDYVFAEDYALRPLAEVTAFIQANKHLPNVPSAAEVNENGINVAEMDATLLRQIEELTLHTIVQEKEIEHMGGQIAELKALVSELLKR